MNHIVNLDGKRYWKDPKGNLVPESAVKELDKFEDQTVRKLVVLAEEYQQAGIEFKEKIFNEVREFIELSATEYDTVIQGSKGGASLYAFNGEYRIQYSVADHINFNNRLAIAKQLIDECILSWSNGASDEIMALINRAFSVDKEGSINVRNVLSLRSLDIKDEKWLKAMDAINDSIKIIGSSEYIRIYKKDELGKYRQIVLDFSKL